MNNIALNRLFKGSLIYGIGASLQRFISLLLLPLFTNFLSPDDFGKIALISLVGISLGGFLTLGTTNSLGIVYFKNKDLKNKQKIVWTTITLLALNGFLWYSIIWFSAPFISQVMFGTADYAFLIRISFLGSIFTCMSDPWLAFLRMEERAKKYVLITLSGAVLTAALSLVAIVILRLGIEGLLLAGTVSAFAMLILTWLLVGREVGYQLEVSYFFPLVKIGFPSIFGLFAFLFIDYADRQMISHMLDLTNLGIYSIGYSFGMIIVIVINAFSASWSPFFMSFINRQEEARKVFQPVLNYYIIIVGTIVFFMFLFSKPVMIMLVPSDFYSAWIVVGLISASYFLKGCYLIILPGIYFSQKLKFQSAIEWVAALINIALNLYFIPVMGILGAALATFISYFTLPVLAWFVSRRYFSVNYDLRRTSYITCFIASFSFLAFKYSQSFDVIESANIFMYFAFSLSYIFGIYFIIINANERKFLSSLRIR